MGTDVLPSFTSPPPAAARGARIGSHRSDQAEASRSPDTDARRLLETRPEGLQELEPLSSTECESKTHRHRHRHTDTWRDIHMCAHICVCVHLSHMGTRIVGHRLLSLQTTANPSGQFSPAPPTRMDPPPLVIITAQMWGRPGLPSWLSLLAWCLPQRVYLFQTSVEIIVVVTRTLVLERGRVASQAGSGCSVKAH